MQDSEFIEGLSATALKKLQEYNAELLNTIKNVDVVRQKMAQIKTPSQSDSASKNLIAQYDELQKQISLLQAKYSALAASQRNNIVITTRGTRATTNNTSATRENTVANQILRAETDRNFRANTLLAGAYARASARLLILKKEAKDAAITFGENSVQAKKAAAAALELDTRIKAADKSVGDHQRNVGNYSSALTKGLQGVFSSVRQLAYILPGIGIAGIFSLALDPLYELIKGLGLFNDKFMEMRKNFNAFRDAEANIRNNTRATMEDLQSLYDLATNATGKAKPEEQAAAIKKLQTEYSHFFAAYSDGAIKSGKAAKELEKVNESIKAANIVDETNEYKKKTEERIDLLQKEVENRKKYREESEKLNNVIRANTVIQNAGTKAAKNVLNEEGKAAQLQLDNLNRERNAQKEYLKEKKEENIINKTDKQLQEDLGSLMEKRSATQDIYNLYLGKALLLQNGINKANAEGRKYDPEGAVLDAKLRYLKELSQANDAEYEQSKNLKEKEVADLEKLAKDENRTFEQRIASYGEMLKKKQEILNDDLIRQKLKLDEQRKVELDAALKAERAELKKAAPANVAERTKEQQDAVNKIIKYYRDERQEINRKFDEKGLLELQKYNDNYTKVVEESSRAQLEIIRHRNEVLMSTEKIYRDEQASNFKKTSDNEKLSVEIRQEAFRAYIALRQKQIDIDRAAAIARAIANDEDVEAVKAQFSVLQNALNHESTTESPFAKTVDQINAEFKSLANTLAGDVFNTAGLSSFKKFFDGTFQETLKGFDLITDKAESTKKKTAYIFSAMADSLVEAMNFINQAQQAQFDAQYDRLEQEKDIAIAFAGESADAKKEIENQYTQRKRQLKRQEAEAEKKNAIFNILIDTAQGVISALASTPPNIPLSIAIGVIGGIQAGIVASTPIPQYKMGTDNHPGGLAIVNDNGKSNYGEIIQTPDGKMSMAKGRNALVDLPKGSKVKTAEETISMLSFNNSLTSLLAGNQIQVAPNTIEIDYSRIGSEFKNALKSGIPRGESFAMNIDHKGLAIFKETENSRTKLLNNKLTLKGNR